MSKIYLCNTVWPDDPKKIGINSDVEKTVEFDDKTPDLDFENLSEGAGEINLSLMQHFILQSAKTEVPVPPVMWSMENVRHQTIAAAFTPDFILGETLLNTTIAFGVSLTCLGHLFQALVQFKLDLPPEFIALLRDIKLAAFHCMNTSKLGAVPASEMSKPESRDFFRAAQDVHLNTVEEGFPILADQDPENKGNHFYQTYLRILGEARERQKLRAARDRAAFGNQFAEEGQPETAG